MAHSKRHRTLCVFASSILAVCGQMSLGTQGDFNGDGEIGPPDWSALVGCLEGPEVGVPIRTCDLGFMDAGNDIDLADVALFQRRFGRGFGPPRVTQCKPAPGDWIVNGTGLNRVEITFSEFVNIPAGAVNIWTVAHGPVLAFSLTYHEDADTLEIILNPPLRGDRVTVVVDFSVVDLAGDELDGEIDDPTYATLPSGNGGRGGQAVFRINVLQGDVNRDGTVDAADGALIAASLGLCTGARNFNRNADLNGDNCVTSEDQAVWEAALGTSLPSIDGQSPTIAGVMLGPDTGPGRTAMAVSLRLSEQVQTASVTRNTCFLTDPAGSLIVPKEVVVAPDGSFITYFFEQPLACGTAYSVYVSNAIADVSGMLLLRPLSPITLLGTTPPLAPNISISAMPTNGGSAFITSEISVGMSGIADNATMLEIANSINNQPLAWLVDVRAGQVQGLVNLDGNKINHTYYTSISACGVRGTPRAIPITQDSMAPSLFVDFPPDQAHVTNEFIDIAGRVADVLSGFMGLTVEVRIDGVPHEPVEEIEGIGTNGTFLASQAHLAAFGPHSIEVTAHDALGNVTTPPRSITVYRDAIPQAAPQMHAIEGGSGQVAPMRTLLPNPIKVRVTHGDTDIGFADKVVTFKVARSDGRLIPANGENCIPIDALTLQCNTNADGYAEAYWRVGSDAGFGNNRVEVTSLDIAGTVFFSASAAPGLEAQINVGAGNSQRVEVGAPAPEPLRVWVNDTCNGVSGVNVTFTVLQGGGKVNGQDTITVPTGPTGHAEVSFVSGPIPGNNIVQATYASNPGSPATFFVYGIFRDETQATSFHGLVLNNASQPIQRVRCTLVVGGQARVTETDCQGQFHFEDLPSAGAADLFVDGREACQLGGLTCQENNECTLEAGSFPFLHYTPVLVPNARNSLPSPALLPPLNPSNAREYTSTPNPNQPGQNITHDVELTCEGIEGLKMIVRAGTTITLPGGGKVGPNDPGSVLLSLNQVHHDDVPMPIPDGAAPPYAGTLQPAGALFHPPVKVIYPNMYGLPPGSITNFMSYDHDTGRFEIVATGPVSADGSTIVTDEGSGISRAGWHCNCPPYAATGNTDCCNHISLWELAQQGLQLAIDITLALANIGEGIECVADIVAAADECIEAWQTVRADGEITSDEISHVGHCVLSVKDAIVNCTGLLPDPSSLAERAIQVSDVIQAALDFALEQECLPLGVQAALNAVSLLNHSINRVLHIAKNLDAKRLLLSLACQKLELILDALSFGGGASGGDDGETIAAVNSLFVEFQSAFVMAIALDDVIVPELIEGTLESAQLQAELEVVIGVLADTGFDATGFVLTMGGQIAMVEEDGGFGIRNITATDASPADSVGDDCLRVSGVRFASGRVEYLSSEPIQIRQGRSVVVRNFSVTDYPPPSVSRIDLGLVSPVLLPGTSSELAVQLRMSDGQVFDVDPASNCANFRPTLRTSNALVATPQLEQGQVRIEAMGLGTAFVSATNQGATAVKRIDVVSQLVHTSIDGFVVCPDGNPAAGASVTTTFGGLATTRGDGKFLFSNLPVPPNVGVTVTASGGTCSGENLVGSKGPLVIVQNGRTDAGIITLKSLAQGPMFANAVSAVGDGPRGLILDDFDGDVDVDVITANNGSDNISLLRNDGQGFFPIAATNVAAADGPRAIVKGNLNASPGVDVAVANYNNNQVSIYLNSGTGFTTPTNVATNGNGPRALAVSDFNGDGHEDIAVVNEASGTVVILRNNGSGQFAPLSPALEVGLAPRGISVGQLNGDSFLDIAVTNAGSDTISVLFGNGRGGFEPQAQFEVGDAPHGIAVGDFNGDGSADVITANYNSDDISVLIGNGTGGFMPQDRYAAGNGPVAVVSGPVDSDAALDLAIANELGDSVTVLRNNGNGMFGSGVTYQTVDSPSAIAMADVNGDGLADLGLTSYSTDRVALLINVGDGAFVEPRSFATGDAPRAIVARDFDLDGDIDVATANWQGDNVSVLMNQGNGTFGGATTYTAGDGPTSMAAADLNVEGHVDLVVANVQDHTVSVFINRGDGTFETPIAYPVGQSPRSVALGDLNGDNRPDIATANFNGDDVTILLNNGEGAFAPGPTLEAGDGPSALIIQDINSDGANDIAVATYASNQLRLYLNVGDGSFDDGAIYPLCLPGQTCDSITSLIAADLDGNGGVDFAATNFSSDRISVSLQNKDSTFTRRLLLDVGDGPRSVAAKDINGDGIVDLVVANASGGTVSVLYGEGGGVFSAAIGHLAGNAPRSVEFGDLDADGDLDLITVAEAADNVTVLLSRGVVVGAQ